MVEFSTWEPYYREITDYFGFSVEDDLISAELLNEFLNEIKDVFWEIRNMIFGKTAYILGAHETVEDGIRYIIENMAIKKDSKLINGKEIVLIAADGVSSALRKMRLKPDLIVSDLDGRKEDLAYWSKKGVPMIVHAHGDNMEKIEEIVPGLDKFIGTTQTKPFGNLYNFGGFTDGDRSVFIANHFNSEKIMLLGFDFENVGKYSFHKSLELKSKKLVWAEKLISLFDVEYLKFG